MTTDTDPEQKPQTRISNVSLAIFIGVTFFTGLYDKGMNSGIPLYYDSIGYSAAVGGSFVAVFTIASMVMRLVGGQITDHFTHYKVLLVSLGCLLLGAIVPAFSDEFYIVMISRVIQGAGFALSANTVTVAVMGAASKKHLGRRVGLEGAGTSGGTMLGALVAVWLLDGVGYHGFFIFYAIIIALAIVAIIVLHKSEVKKGIDDDSHAKKSTASTGTTASAPAAKKRLHELIAPYLLPQVFPYLLLGFARRLPKGFCVAFILIFTKQVGIAAGATFFVMAGIATLVCRLTLGKIFDSNKTWLLLPMLCIEAIGLLVFAVAPSFITLIIAGLGYGITIGTTSPFIKTLTAKNAPKEHWGAVNGELYFFSDLGKALGAFLGGVIIDAVGKALIPQIAVIFAIIPCVVAAIALLISHHQNKIRQRQTQPSQTTSNK